MALAALLVTACGGADDRRTRVDGSAPKSGTGELRTDIEPLTRRFTELGPSLQAQWMSGTFGDPDVPGPSTYWIDAVVVLPPPKVAELTTRYAPAATPERPDVVSGLRARLPAGPFRTGPALDTALRPDQWTVRAYLDPAAHTIVLVALGA